MSLNFSTLLATSAILACSCIAQAAEVSDSRLVGATKCSLEMSISQSPSNYLIAVVEPTGDTDCSGHGCSETLKVKRVFAYRNGASADAPEHIVAIMPKSVSSDRIDGTSPFVPKGQMEIGIYLPVPNGNQYYPSSVSTPVTPEMEAIYERATKAALEAPADKPDCKSLFASASPVKRPVPEDFHVYARFPGVLDEELIKQVDAVLRPLGYSRQSEGTKYPMPEVKGIFAFYATDGPSSLLIVEGKVPGCTSIAITDYDESNRGRATRVGGTLVDSLRRQYAKTSTFYKDDRCLNAL
jgi:hypothetical protein